MKRKNDVDVATWFERVGQELFQHTKSEAMQEAWDQRLDSQLQEKLGKPWGEGQVWNRETAIHALGLLHERNPYVQDWVLRRTA